MHPASELFRRTQARMADRSLINVDKTEHWFTKEACKDEAVALKLLCEQPQIASKTKPGLPSATPLIIALENRSSDKVVRKLLGAQPKPPETACGSRETGPMPMPMPMPMLMLMRMLMLMLIRMLMLMLIRMLYC